MNLGKRTHLKETPVNYYRTWTNFTITYGGMKMFKLIKAAAQLREARAEIKRLNSKVGEEVFPDQDLPDAEGMEMENSPETVTIMERLQVLENIEIERIMGGIE